MRRSGIDGIYHVAKDSRMKQAVPYAEQSPYSIKKAAAPISRPARIKGASSPYSWRLKPQNILPGMAMFFVILILLSTFTPLFDIHHKKVAYDLSAASHLLSETPQYLQDKLKYDNSQHQWVFNQEASTLPSDPSAATSVGGISYTAQLPFDLRNSPKGMSLTDVERKLEINLKPKFSLDPAKKEQGHLVYPITGRSAQLVYSFTHEGAKEDIILYKSPGNTARYSYEMRLPAGMEARKLDDGSVGIFGGDPKLFGNISFGSDQDKALVDKARSNSSKTHLYYVIPAPVISGDTKNSAKASILLKNNELVVEVTGLSKANYPLSIDPSFVMDTSGCKWLQAGNNEGNTDYSGCQLKRSGLSGAATGTWATANIGTASFARINPNVVAYNGYLYIGGGLTVGTGSGGANSQINDVSYARICDGTVTTNGCSAGAGNAGKLGNWSTASHLFNNARQETTMLAYNGYLYIIGGTSTGNTAFDDTQFALICTGNNNGIGGCGSTPGDLGTWNYGNGTASQAGATGIDGSKLNSRAARASTVVYKNRIYVVGGCNTLPINACNSNGNTTTQSAAINGDGTIGIWSNLSAGIPTSLYVGGGGAAYNSHVYIVGGCTSKNGLGVCNGWGSYTAAIKSDGTLDAWIAIANPVSNDSGSVGVYKGYLYYGVGGGTNQVFLAKIYANGDTGPWQSSTAYGTARYSTAYLFFNGYAYLVEGCTNGNTNCQAPNGSTADIQVTTISSTLGPTSGYTTSSNVIETDGIFGGATVAYGGYLYILGGTNAPSLSNHVNTVYYAKINNDGSTGTWGTTSAFNQARFGATAVAYNGYMYLMGGWHNASNTACNATAAQECSDVQKAVINSDGTLGAWSSAGSAFSSQPRWALGGAVYNGYLYVFGGIYNNNSTLSQETNVGQIQTNGNVTGWTTTGNMGTASGTFATAQSGPYVYAIGGRAAGANSNGVQYAVLSNTGTATWGNTSTFTNGREQAIAGVSNGYVYLMGGNFGAGTNNYADVQYARICYDTALVDGCNGTVGTLGTWHSTTSFGTARGGHMGTLYNGFIYIMGGCSNWGLLGSCSGSAALLNDLQYAQIYNGGGGAAGTWSTSAQTMATARLRSRVVVNNGYLYAISGCSGWTTIITPGCNALTGTVEYAQINASTGDLGSWSTTTAGVTAREFFGAFTYDGYIYVLGGCTAIGCNATTNAIQYAKPDASGNVTSWLTNPTNMPFSSSTRAVTAGGRAYVFSTSNSYYTTIDPVTHQINGSSWTAGTNYLYTYSPGASFEAVTNGKYIYLLGGLEGGSGANTKVVVYVQINTDGSLGSWAYAPSMNSSRHDGWVVTILNGYIYVGPGYSGGSSATNEVTYAAINSDGSLGSWQVGPGLQSARTCTAGIAYNGYLYVVGGLISSNPDDTTEWAPLQSTPQVARHSMLLATDKRTKPANFFSTVSGQNPNSLISVGVSTANDPAVALNSIGTSTGIGSAAKYQLTPGNDGTKYYWLSVVLDDSQSATFGETSGSSMSYLQLNYHPNPSMRLRGGKTFNSATQQSLDAP